MNKIKFYYNKYHEIAAYIISGAATTVISWCSYALFYYVIKLENTTSNIISWFLAVTFAFITSKYWVFESKGGGEATFIKEAFSFYGARLFTGILETVLMYLLVDLLGLSGMIMKIAVSVIICIINFFLSKFWIFKRK